MTKETVCKVGVIAFVVLCIASSAAYAAISPKVNARQIRDFGRITFNWPEKVRFKVNSSGNTVTLTFNKAASIDLSPVRQSLSPYVTSSSVSPDGTTVTLTLNHDYSIRHFMSGNANGIDILSLKEQGSAAAAPAPPPTTVPKPTPKPVAAQTTAQPAFIPPISPAKPVNAAPQTQPAPAAESEPKETIADATPNIPEEAPKAEPVVTEVTAQEPTPEAASEPAIATPAPAPDQQTPQVEEPAKPEQIAQAPLPAIEEPEIASPVQTATEPEAPAVEPQQDFSQFVADGGEEPELITNTSTAQAPQSTKPPSHGPFLVTAKPLPSGAEINFPWRARVGAAAFFRYDVLWVVFNEQQDVNIDLLESILPAAVSKVEKVDMPGHTILRMTTDGSMSAKMSKRDGVINEWQLTLSTNRKIPIYPVMLELKPTARTPNVYIPVLEYGDSVTITDPTIGDELIVTPFYRNSTGIYPTRDFVDFTALETAQGMAIVKKGDRVRVTELRNGLRIDRKGQRITLSQDMPALTLDELESLKDEYATLFPYEKWKIEPGTMDEVREELERKIINASDVRRNSLRLKLAQTFLGEGMSYETIGLLELIKQDDPDFYKERNLAALDAAAHFMAYRYGSAIQLFNSPEIRKLKEVKMWNDAMQVFQKSRPRFDYLDHYDVYIKKYPPRLREKLAILATDNYINRRSYKRALKTLDTLSETGVEPNTMHYIDYLLGKISAATDNIAGAIALWTPLTEQENNRFVRARAQYSLTTLLYAKDQINIDEAIDRLDQLRIVWRGDSLELNLLSYLGQLYNDRGDYLPALRAWREITQQFPESPIAIDAQALMGRTFNYLFAEGGADTLEPLAALSTFYEFRELTPIGVEGDVMIQSLADRLAAVDLLDRAAALLEHQIKFRQEKDARSKLAAQLAVIYLLNEKPQPALDVLELTGYGQNTKELDDKRRHLTAMALTELDEHDRALEVLKNDDSVDAKKLRLGIFWKTKDWLNIIDVAENLLSSRDNVTAPLSKEESDTLLQLSIAYVFQRDNLQLQYLRNYFEPILNDSATKDMFMFITDATGPIDPAAFGEVAKQINSMKSFMKSYRNKVSEGKLSSVLN